MVNSILILLLGWFSGLGANGGGLAKAQPGPAVSASAYRMALPTPRDAGLFGKWEQPGSNDQMSYVVTFRPDGSFTITKQSPLGSDVMEGTWDTDMEGGYIFLTVTNSPDRPEIRWRYERDGDNLRVRQGRWVQLVRIEAIPS